MAETADTALRLREATGPADMATIHTLFLEYAETLNFDLCFQDFDAELAGLPGDYAPPAGRLLLAEVGARVAGCVGFRPMADGAAEMKRLWVRPGFRGHGLGRLMTERVIALARETGCPVVRLDTVDGQMDAAIALYRRLGFREVPGWYESPVAAMRWFALDLAGET